VQSAGSDFPAGSLLLLSSGGGDVALVASPAAGQQQQPQQQAADSGSAAVSPAVFPLRPAPPLQGVRPVHLAAAFVLPPAAALHAASSEQQGQQPAAGAAGEAPASPLLAICCILWAVRPHSSRQNSRCEVYAVRFAAAAGPAQPTLAVQAVQLLKVRRQLLTSLPPASLSVNLCHHPALAVHVAVPVSLQSVATPAALHRHPFNAGLLYC